MRTMRFMLVALMVLLLASAQGLTQFPEGGGKAWQGKGGGRKGGFGGRGGMGGGGRGGMGGGGMSRDPNTFFDMMARGKDVINRADLDPNFQSMFDRMASGLGITNGQITRQQFATSIQQLQQQRGGGGGPGSGGSPVPENAENRDGPGENRGGRGGRGGGWNPEGMADRMFQRIDQNGDGLLNFDEMPEALQQEREKWDMNKDGFVDATEFRSYMQARIQQAMNDRGGAGGDGWGGGGDSTPVEEEKKPIVYRVGKLPKEVPPWFAQLDTDKDAQIGLYEWKAGGKSLDEFVRMDKNNDGFLTVDEVLRFVALNKPGENPQSPGEERTAVMNFGPGGGGGFGRDRGGPGAIEGGDRGVGRGRFGGGGPPGGGEGMRGRGGRGRGGEGSGGQGGGRGRGSRN